MSHASRKPRKLRDRHDSEQDRVRLRDWLLETIAVQRAKGDSKFLVDAMAQLAQFERQAEPTRPMIAQFQYLYRKAQRLEMPDIASQALLGISREHACAGALLIALKYCDDALRALGTTSSGSSYWLAQLERSRLLAKLDRKEEAHALLSELLGAPGLDERLRQDAERLLQEVTAAGGLPTAARRAAPSEMEAKVLEFLREGPRTKFDLIQELWGDQVDVQVAENRLKNLLNRIRQKNPGLIRFAGGAYSLVDSVFHVKRKAG